MPSLRLLRSSEQRAGDGRSPGEARAGDRSRAREAGGTKWGIVRRGRGKELGQGKEIGKYKLIGQGKEVTGCRRAVCRGIDSDCTTFRLV